MPDWLKKRLFPQQTPDDQRILDDTLQLAAQLRFRVMPMGVWWTNKMSIGTKGGKVSIASDFPRVNGVSVIIAERVKGMLGPEELKPLIASSLLYYNGPIQRNLTSKVLGKVILPLFLLGSAIEGILYFFRTAWTAVAFVPLIIILALLAKLSSTPLSRNAWLVADRKVATLLGGNSLVQALDKIDGLGLADVKKLKRGGRFTGRPSITRRIENLQTSDFSQEQPA